MSTASRNSWVQRVVRNSWVQQVVRNSWVQQVVRNSWVQQVVRNSWVQQIVRNLWVQQVVTHEYSKSKLLTPCLLLIITFSCYYVVCIISSLNTVVTDSPCIYITTILVYIYCVRVASVSPKGNNNMICIMYSQRSKYIHTCMWKIDW